MPVNKFGFPHGSPAKSGTKLSGLAAVALALFCTGCSVFICGFSGGCKGVKVVDSAGTPIQGVQVSTASPAQPSSMNVTDQHGRVTVLKDGVIRFRAVGYDVASFEYSKLPDVVVLMKADRPSDGLPEW